MHSRVKPEFKLAVYRAGIQYGRDKEWDFIWKQYKETDVPSEKRHLLGALSTTRDASKLPRSGNSNFFLVSIVLLCRDASGPVVFN